MITINDISFPSTEEEVMIAALDMDELVRKIEVVYRNIADGWSWKITKPSFNMIEIKFANLIKTYLELMPSKVIVDGWGMDKFRGRSVDIRFTCKANFFLTFYEKHEPDSIVVKYIREIELQDKSEGDTNS